MSRHKRPRTPKLRHVPIYLGAGAIFFTIVFFLASEVLRDEGDSWLILTGSAQPTGANWYEGMIAGSLAVMGYLLLPAIVGLAVSVGLGNFVDSQRKSVEDLKDEIHHLIDRGGHLDLRNSPSVSKSSASARRR